jgi:hypothetical protein
MGYTCLDFTSNSVVDVPDVTDVPGFGDGVGVFSGFTPECTSLDVPDVPS